MRQSSMFLYFFKVVKFLIRVRHIRMCLKRMFSSWRKTHSCARLLVDANVPDDDEDNFI